jgi:tetratricopeptide (TPR) repeat protein
LIRSVALANVVLFTALAPSPALAQRKHTETPEERTAREYYDKGLRHYDLGEFDDAITEFKQAYAIVPTPSLLFNIAQAYRLKKDYDQSLYFYQTYLRLAPSAPNRKDVEARIEEIQRLKAEQEQLPKQPPHEAIKPEENATPPTSPPKPSDHGPVRSGRTLKIAGLSTAAAGVAALGAGIYFGLKARSSSNDLTTLEAQHGAWSSHYLQVLDDGQTAATRANILYAVGGAVVATGGVLYYLGWRRDAERNASVALAPGGAMVAFWGRF